MKTKETTNTNYVPAHRSTSVDKLPEFINYLLPVDCKIESRADAYYLSAIASLCATFIFPPFIILAGYCIFKAKKQKGAKQ